MIRVIAVMSLLMLLVLVLYVPSAHPPEHFVAQIRREHDSASQFWGQAAALRMLERAAALQQATASSNADGSAAVFASTSPALSHDVAREMASVNQRLFNNAYFRSVDALLALASYRLSMLVEWLPWLAAFLIVALVDSGLARARKAKEFMQHDPEWFALWAGAAIAAACAGTVALVLPVPLHPLVMPATPLLIALLCALAVRSFHRRA